MYGQAGLAILQPIRLQNKHIFRLKLFLKKSARKADKTTRKLWFNAFIYLFPKNLKVHGWVKVKVNYQHEFVRSSVMLVELKNLRPGYEQSIFKTAKISITGWNKYNILL